MMDNISLWWYKEMKEWNYEKNEKNKMKFRFAKWLLLFQWAVDQKEPSDYSYDILQSTFNPPGAD